MMHMPRQLCCRGMYKILAQMDEYFLNEMKNKFHQHCIFEGINIEWNELLVSCHVEVWRDHRPQSYNTINTTAQPITNRAPGHQGPLTKTKILSWRWHENYKIISHGLIQRCFSKKLHCSVCLIFVMSERCRAISGQNHITSNNEKRFENTDEWE